MTLPASGPISFNAINVELGVSGTTQASLGQASYRTLAGVASGQISMNNFYGKSNRATVNLTITSTTTNYDIFSNRGGSYVPGKTDVILTINSGVVVGSASTGAYALDTGTGWTSGDTIKIVNNGYIVGRGGAGGTNAHSGGGTGGAGGPALRAQFAVSVQNNNIIGGGGGGGAGSYYVNDCSYIGLSGGDGAGYYGANTTNGGGGSAGNAYFCNSVSSAAGGAAGSNGSDGQNTACYNYYMDCSDASASGGGGGGLGGSGGRAYNYYNGGGPGAATSGAGTYITWLATGQRYGSIG